MLDSRDDPRFKFIPIDIHYEWKVVIWHLGTEDVRVSRIGRDSSQLNRQCGILHICELIVGHVE